MCGAIAALLYSTAVQAQCTKDTDCKGERVCTAGSCVDPAAGAPPSDAAAPAPSESAETAGKSVESVSADRPAGERTVTRRHSTGMMAGGIVMVSLAPIALLGALVSSLQDSVCDITYDSYGMAYARDDCDNSGQTYAFALAGVALLGAGIPLIIIGAKKETVPAPQATLSPWVSAQGGGVRLKLAL
jgi:hypothetical protein